MAKRNVLFLLLLCAFSGLAQERKSNFVARYLNWVINDTTQTSKPQFLIYPTLAYAPETNWELGLSSVFVFYAQSDTTNRLSETSAFTFVTLEKQYGLWMDHALYSHQNTWFSLGRLRFQSFPLLYHGVGPKTPEEPLAQVNANLIQIKERGLRKVYGDFYAGLEIDFQHLNAVEFVPLTQGEFEFPTGHEGSTNVGLGAGLLYDNRHNVLNVRHGAFSELAFLHYHPLWSDYSFTSIISDFRVYHSMNKRDVLAAHVFGQFTTGNTPFNQLALLGGESIMRGYYQGRYRDKNQVAAQVEYRMLPLPWAFTRRWGAAFFGGAGTVFGNGDTISIQDVNWAGGAGLRFLLFPKKDIFTRLDLAFTNEGTGIYIFIGEAF